MNPPSVQGLNFNLPQAWGNGTATPDSVTGWDGTLDGSGFGCGSTIPWLYNYGLPHTEVVPGTVTNTGCRLRTYVYRLVRYVVAICEATADYGYFPTSPSNVQFAATVLGDPPPAAPQNLRITNTSNTPIQLTWDANQESDISLYEVWRNDITLQTGWQLIASTSSTAYTDNAYIWATGAGNDHLEYKVRAKDAGGLLSSYSNVVAVDAEPAFRRAPDGDISISLPPEFSLKQNYPNPFNPETEISLSLPEPSMLRIVLSDLLGRELVTLVDRAYSAGHQRVIWKGTDRAGNKVGSGIYFYRITAIGQSGKHFTKVMKMALSK